MGRRRKGEVIEVTAENEALAREYMETISRFYEDYIKLFDTMFEGNGSDIAAETLLKTANAIRNNGFKKLKDEKKEQCFKNYFFSSAKLNYITFAQDQMKRKGIFNYDTENIDIEEISAEEKVMNDIYQDYKVMWLVNLVEDTFDPITFRCWRLKHLIPKMTYERLREITGIRNAKQRVVEVNRFLKENVNEDMVRQDYNTE